MLSTLTSISSLLFSFGLLCLGHGLLNTLLSIRASVEDYSDMTVGLMMSAYYVGFIIGTRFSRVFIHRVGHIRTFAASASIISAITLMHFMVLDPFVWVGLRFVYGIFICGMYMVLESWLSSLSSSANRGRILSIYMIVNFVAISMSQLFFTLNDGVGFLLFGIVSILASLSLVPIILSRAVQPRHEDGDASPFSFRQLISISPLACMGEFATGIANSAFWGMGAIFLYQIGYSAQNVALFIALSFLGGLILQWPIGFLSDQIGRRATIAMIALGACVASVLILYYTNAFPSAPFSLAFASIAFMFGGFTYPLHSLYISLANDYVEPHDFVRTSAGLFVLQGIGAVIGPSAAAAAMFILGPSGLPVLMVVIYALVTGFTFLRMIKGREAPYQESFIALPRTANAMYGFDPRGEEEK